MSNVLMRADGTDTIECDSCEKRARLRGELTEPPRWYGLIDGRETDDPGGDQMFDFCSLACLTKWAERQRTAPKEGASYPASECRCAACRKPGEYPMNSPCPLGWMAVNTWNLCSLTCLTLWVSKRTARAARVAR